VGVKYDENFQPIFSIAETSLERDEHRGSKYIQPVISTNTLSEIEKLVKLGKYILISGSPCMIAGIKSLFKLRRLDVERVVFVDIVCHGVPSPQMWRDYLDVLEKKYDSKVISYSFRDKTKGWRGYHIRVQFENGLVVEDTDEVNSFVSLFKENLSLRDSCHKCPYTSFSRCGDITIGDFWGIERIDPEFSDNTGISMVFTNSTKGIDIINTIKSKLVYKCYSSRVVIQPNLHKPSEYGLDNKKFWRIYKKKGYLAVINRFSKGGSYYFLYYYKKAIKIRLNRMKNRTN
jgi:coenzyme F420-reducing hydrogenase beta subunit